MKNRIIAAIAPALLMALAYTLVSASPASAACPGALSNSVTSSSVLWQHRDQSGLMGTMGTAMAGTCVTAEEPAGPHACGIGAAGSVVNRFGWATYSSGANNNTSLACRFTCPTAGIDCRIRGGDGLPVELLQFGVE